MRVNVLGFPLVLTFDGNFVVTMFFLSWSCRMRDAKCQTICCVRIGTTFLIYGEAETGIKLNEFVNRTLL